MIAWIFPGQGAQYVGMGRDFARSFPLARETFEQADDLLKENLSKIIFEGPEELLAQTRYSQLGILVVSIALFRVLASQLPALKPSICAGLSLGEYTALVASGRLCFERAVLLVRERARLMEEACINTPGAMAVVLGLDFSALKEALQGIDGVWIANQNCPSQLVISGEAKAVEQAGVSLKERGAKRVVPLQVQGAFHSPLMALAERGLAPFIGEAPFCESEVALVMNASGDFVTDTERLRKELMSQVTQPVLWQKGIEAIEGKGVELYVEIGCGKTLSGMNRKIGVRAPTLSLEKEADLEMIASQVKK